MILRKSLLASVIALGVLIAAAGAALAYTGEVPANVTVTTSGPIVAGSPIAVHATVLGPSATGVPNVSVAFAITCAPAGAADKLSASSAVTDANGVATVNLTLSAVAGQRCVSATAEGGVLGQVSINLLPSGLPNTSTSEPTSGSPVPLGLALILAAAGLVAMRRSLRPRGETQP
jgi:hypothetical protein